MAFLSNRQSPTQPVSGRATVAHLNRAQQPRPAPISGRALVGQLGIGRRYTGLHDLLTPRQLLLPEPPAPDFYRLRADAQRLQQQLATPDTLARSSALALPPARTPAQAGYPIPFLSPAQQQHRAHERARARAQRQQQALAAYNRAAQAPYISPFLRKVLSQPLVSLLRPEPAGPTGSDLFMPNSFWKSQNPYNDPKVGWAQCCATVKKMMGSFYGKIPTARIDLVQEHQSPTEWKHGYRVHDGYVPAPNSTRAQQGLRQLDEYLAAHKPVMVGVSHTLGLLFSKKDKNGVVHYYPINDGTIDHFVAIVGTGQDKKGKYYRFFDVGTINANRAAGTSPLNRLYYNPATGFYEGNTQVGNKHKYTLTQLRFF